MKLKRLGLILIGLFLSTGCMDTTDRFVLNPDGSGRVVHEIEFEPLNLSMGGDSDSKNSEADLKKTIREELEKVQGVEVWKDVEYERRQGKRIYFKGTAYFKDINAVKFHNSGTNFGLYNQIKFTKNNDEISIEITDKKDKEKADKPAKKLTEEQIEAKLQKNLDDYNSKKMLLAGMLGGLKVNRTFELPGTEQQATNVKALEANKYQFEFRGSQLLEIFDVMMQDKEQLREEIRAGRDPFNDGPKNDFMINKQLFGEEAGVKVVMSAAQKPLFDYAAEVAAAQKAYPAITKALGVTPKVILPSGKPGEFRVGAVRAIFEEDPDNEIRPFNFGPGYAIYIIGVLPQPAFAVTEGRLTVAKTDSGEDLLKESEWDRKINFPTLGKDKTTVGFDASLLIPSKRANKISELSGVLNYSVGSSIKSVDLGITSFTEGSQGTEFDAVVKTVGESDWNKGKYELAIKVAINRHKVKSIKLYDQTGNEVKFSQGYMASNDITTYTLTLSDGPAPTTGKIVLDVYENVTAYELPFTLTDIDLIKR